MVKKKASKKVSKKAAPKAPSLSRDEKRKVAMLRRIK